MAKGVRAALALCWVVERRDKEVQRGVEDRLAGDARQGMAVRDAPSDRIVREDDVDERKEECRAHAAAANTTRGDVSRRALGDKDSSREWQRLPHDRLNEVVYFLSALIERGVDDSGGTGQEAAKEILQPCVVGSDGQEKTC